MRKILPTAIFTALTAGAVNAEQPKAKSSTGGSAAPSNAAKSQDPAKAPPFAIGGFKYELLSPQIHMNVCAQPGCVPGSKVSYIMSDTGGPTFEVYKQSRRQIEEVLKKRAQPGVTLEFSEPTEKGDRAFKIYESRRTETAASGTKSYFLSSTLNAPGRSVDLISSSSDLKAAESNLKLFMLGAMALMAAENSR